MKQLHKEENEWAGKEAINDCWHGAIELISKTFIQLWRCEGTKLVERQNIVDDCRWLCWTVGQCFTLLPLVSETPIDCLANSQNERSR
jgi:hypothetical protein